jgi:tetratricopeptide (TPR) repeat protein
MSLRCYVRSMRVTIAITLSSLALSCANKPASESPATEPGAEPVVFIEAAPDPQARRPGPEQPPDAGQGPSELDRERAKQLFIEGVALYEAGDLEGAVERFEQANQLAPMPALRFNIARIRQQLGDTVGACAAYAELLADPNTDESIREHASRARIELGC